MRNIFITSLAIFFLVNCASNAGKNNRARNIEVSKHSKLVLADKDSDEKVICKQARRIGSNRITTICRSQSEIKKVRDATQIDLHKRIQGGPGGASESGGL